MEKRSQKENELNKRLNRWASIGWWEADFTDKTLTCSESLSEKLGILGKGCVMSFEDWGKLVHPDCSKRVMREFYVLCERDSYDVEYRLRLPNGEYDCHIYDRHGNFNGHMVIYYDITDQLNTELRLKEFSNIFSLKCTGR